MDFYRAMAQPFISIVNDTDLASDVRRLEFLVHEIRRLLDNPGLFPSEPARMKFLSLLGLDAGLQFSRACSDLLIEGQVSALEVSRNKNYSQVPYQAGLKSWENFLRNMAPGAPQDPSNRARTEPKSSFQMVPAVGLRIVADFEREEQGIIRYINRAQGNLGVQPAKSTLLLDWSKETIPEEIPRLRMSQHTERVIATPNPYRPGRSMRNDVCIHSAQPLEEIAPFLHHIENPNAVMDWPDVAPHSFPCFAIRQWHGPVPYNGLRFIRPT